MRISTDWLTGWLASLSAESHGASLDIGSDSHTHLPTLFQFTLLRRWVSSQLPLHQILEIRFTVHFVTHFQKTQWRAGSICNSNCLPPVEACHRLKQSVRVFCMVLSCFSKFFIIFDGNLHVHYWAMTHLFLNHCISIIYFILWFIPLKYWFQSCSKYAIIMKIVSNAETVVCFMCHSFSCIVFIFFYWLKCTY